MVPVIFKIERESLPTIVKVTGMTKTFPFGDSFLLSKALEVIGIFEKSGGRILTSENGEKIEKIPNQILVQFHMIFKNQEELLSAIEEMQKMFG